MNFNQLNIKLNNSLPKSLDQLCLNVVSDEIIGPVVVKLLEECANYIFSSHWKKGFELADVLVDKVWEHLNIGHWKDVSIEWRYAYTFASLFKSLSQLAIGKLHYESVEIAIKTCDLGLLMGAPVLNSILSRLITILNKNCVENSYEPETKKYKVENINSFSLLLDKKKSVKRINCPSIQNFQTEYILKHEPVLLDNCMNLWPALSNDKSWSVEYIKKVAGNRTVPIEIGSKYTEDDWSQTLMTVSEFIDKFILNDDKIGYLAQHQLFEQVPELRDDILIPDYCCITNNSSGIESIVDINAWFGPKGTISPLHHDPKNNFLCQVFGSKYIRLYATDQTQFLYPHPEPMLCNTSQVDVENPNFQMFPLFSKAKYLECVLEPGTMLYIPPKYWHYVRSLSVSFSTSFWWV